MYFIRILVICLSVTACSSGEDKSQNESKISGLYYSFEGTGETVTDKSGSQYHGNASYLWRVPGKVGNAVEFYNYGSSIELPSIDDYYPFNDEFTVRVWVKLDNTVSSGGGIYHILGPDEKSDSTGLGGFGFGLVADRAFLELPDHNSLVASVTPDLGLPINEWFNLAVTYDGSTIAFYFNGNLVYTDRLNSTDQNRLTLRIGNEGVYTDRLNLREQFFGAIDELYLENIVLSSHQITDYYLETM